MSLKAFHVVFVTVATLVTSGFGVWCLRQPGGEYMAIGLAAMLGAAALIVYGFWFLKKTKGVSLL